ncbi:glycosyltransferase [Arthrobacter sp. DNA4]|uniref:rhamnosyltransferase WsaF family glycosyltransferase n=1 Tax=Micrococcaceae TaxID=1268 RepID=UPI0020CC3F95|nr:MULTISPECIES: glycosyltransferase [Micrococcaceae]UTT69581.1 glycosyltransferase [Arthrobacter sp. DNA4]WRT13886.1 glycosyltransferase [Pseudarthrobacter sp. LT1]
MTRVSVNEVIARAKARGIADTSRRAIRRLYGELDARLGLQPLNFPLDAGDVSSSTGMGMREPRSFSGPMHIGWLITPPIPGAGGHTTFFRMVRGMEERGHRCTILVYNRNDGAMERHRSIIRKYWPSVLADVHPVPGRLDGLDACVASSWETAHVLAARIPRRGGPSPHYFIQDYEPYFHPRGSLYSLAEDSYRFGFNLMALGPMVAEVLKREVGVQSTVLPFGSDVGTYRITNTAGRSGVVFFAKPEAERRGYDMGRLALQEFHRMQPRQEINVYGARATGWGIPVQQHGRVSPQELNELYNRTISGLALSFTNITLVAAEMLAAGNVPVLNDDSSARSVLTNPEAVWAAPNPTDLAKALSDVVAAAGTAERSARAARAAAHREYTWAETQASFAQAITGRKFSPSRSR